MATAKPAGQSTEPSTESPTKSPAKSPAGASAQPSTQQALSPTETVELSPSYRVPVGVLAIALSLVFLSPWGALPVALFGLFLAYQASSLRLRFTATALDVQRGNNPPFRSFPYSEWENWRIYWPAVPILFYFKEINSIHFLPVLFNPRQLQECLEARCPRLD
ncbi:MAG: DUF3119 family protein [Synechococcales cyanobacterium RU_4_20]|nr:DUF3119 family protein [Synechococcales cyanobacterium RU_4_20]NJR67602.1 DUF3119 family protein [Synechococcales cyanobacterium CRU_2_2]